MRYKVIFESEAQKDIQSQYDWGCRAWGLSQARKWVRELRATTGRQLATVPLGCPIAPDQEEYPVEVRQMVFGRYRILYTVQKKTVHILAVRGAYVSPDMALPDDADE